MKITYNQTMTPLGKDKSGKYGKNFTHTIRVVINGFTYAETYEVLENDDVSEEDMAAVMLEFLADQIKDRIKRHKAEDVFKQYNGGL